jgi:hypothetical protein
MRALTLSIAFVEQITLVMRVVMPAATVWRRIISWRAR